MSQIFNIYCDESCHLESDKKKAMVLGAVWLPMDKVKQASIRLREIKEQHGLKRNFEAKWTKISPGKEAFYRNLVDYFFDDDDFHFRCLVIPDKSKLAHSKFNQSHDDWYYKMYFNLLKVIFDPNDKYRIYLDIKDSRGGMKVSKLHDVLCNTLYDFDKKIIERVQIVRSHDIEILQLADILIGAVSSLHRGETKSEAKWNIIKRIQQRSGYSLERTTLYREEKANIFIWHPSED